ncbi:MAG: undecaprenyl-diphosphate phosphatase [Candidatus Berkelbacteria bacterium]|nr:undecaprenyl-diphosphate phosphatase [Candidatus Berkelbacteria bacterium]
MFFQLFQALVYGLVQGIAEFLPISSTAHLILIPYFFHWKDPGLSFDVFLHLGTLIAIIYFFAKDWFGIFKEKKYKLLALIIIACIPAAILGYAFESKIEISLRSPLLIASTLAIFGLIIYLVDRLIKHTQKLKNMNYWQSILIGLGQSLALIPGISRSGATMTAGIALGFKRRTAAKFSFLIATPIMLGATIFRAKDLSSLPINDWFNGFSLFAAIIGFLAALISGYLSIKYLLKYLSHGSFTPFVIYRIVLAIIIIIFYILK